MLLIHLLALDTYTANLFQAIPQPTTLDLLSLINHFTVKHLCGVITLSAELFSQFKKNSLSVF